MVAEGNELYPLAHCQSALNFDPRSASNIDPVPPAAQPGYLMGIRLERYIAEGLRKLGCGGA